MYLHEPVTAAGDGASSKRFALQALWSTRSAARRIPTVRTAREPTSVRSRSANAACATSEAAVMGRSSVLVRVDASPSAKRSHVGAHEEQAVARAGEAAPSKHRQRLPRAS